MRNRRATFSHALCTTVGSASVRHRMFSSCRRAMTQCAVGARCLATSAVPKPAYTVVMMRHGCVTRSLLAYGVRLCVGIAVPGAKTS
jgi:hypothetical protein